MQTIYFFTTFHIKFINKVLDYLENIFEANHSIFSDKDCHSFRPISHRFVSFVTRILQPNLAVFPHKRNHCQLFLDKR